MTALAATPDLASIRERYLKAQLDGDRRAAMKLVLDDGLAAGASVADLHEHVLQAAQREIGRLWQENLVTVAQEHMATAISNYVLSQLFERAPAKPRNGKRVIVACVEGELHEFPARLVADALDLGGFDVVFLGANVPVDSLLRLTQAAQPDLVALSATMSFHAPALRRAVAALRAQHGTGLPIAVGGNALSWSETLAGELAVEIIVPSARELTAAAAQLLKVGE